MRSMVLGLMAGLCVAGAALPAVAQETTAAVAAPNPQAKALAQRYLDAIQFETLMVGAMEPLLDMITAQQTDLTEDQRATVRAVVMDSFKAVMPTYLDQVTTLYGDTLSVEELEALVAFYETPLGRSVTQKSLLLTGQSKAMFEQFQPVLNAEIMKRIGALAAAE